MLSGDRIRYWPVVLFTAAYAAFVATLIVAREPAEGTRSAAPVATAPALSEAPASTPGTTAPDLRGGLAREIAVGEAPPVEREAVAFDLPDPRGEGASAGTSRGAAVEISKGVRINGAEAGEATIRVSGSSTLAISAEALGRMLARTGHGEAAGLIGTRRGFVDFEELRRQGIDVRYDLGSDRVAISL